MQERSKLDGAQRADELRRNIWKRAATTAFVYNTGKARSFFFFWYFWKKSDDCAHVNPVYSDERLGARVSTSRSAHFAQHPRAG